MMKWFFRIIALGQKHRLWLFGTVLLVVFVALGLLARDSTDDIRAARSRASAADAAANRGSLPTVYLGVLGMYPDPSGVSSVWVLAKAQKRLAEIEAQNAVLRLVVGAVVFAGVAFNLIFVLRQGGVHSGDKGGGEGDPSGLNLRPNYGLSGESWTAEDESLMATITDQDITRLRNARAHVNAHNVRLVEVNRRIGSSILRKLIDDFDATLRDLNYRVESWNSRKIESDFSPLARAKVVAEQLNRLAGQIVPLLGKEHFAEAQQNYVKEHLEENLLKDVRTLLNELTYVVSLLEPIKGHEVSAWDNRNSSSSGGVQLPTSSAGSSRSPSGGRGDVQSDALSQQLSEARLAQAKLSKDLADEKEKRIRAESDIQRVKDDLSRMKRDFQDASKRANNLETEKRKLEKEIEPLQRVKPIVEFHTDGNLGTAIGQLANDIRKLTISVEDNKIGAEWTIEQAKYEVENLKRAFDRWERVNGDPVDQDFTALATLVFDMVRPTAGVVIASQTAPRTATVFSEIDRARKAFTEWLNKERNVRPIPALPRVSTYDAQYHEYREGEVEATDDERLHDRIARIVRTGFSYEKAGHMKYLRSIVVLYSWSGTKSVAEERPVELSTSTTRVSQSSTAETASGANPPLEEESMLRIDTKIEPERSPEQAEAASADAPDIQQYEAGAPLSIDRGYTPPASVFEDQGQP